MSFRISRSKLEKKVVFASLVLLALLLASGGLVQVNATRSSANSSSAGVSMQKVVTDVAPSRVSTVTKMGTSPALSAIVLSPKDNAAIAKAESNAAADKTLAGANGPASNAAHFVPPIVSP